MTITATFELLFGDINVIADADDNAITIIRDLAGNIVINGGTVPITGGAPTVTNTVTIRVNGADGNDVVVFDETNGPLPVSCSATPATTP